MTWVRQVTAGKAAPKALLILLGELANEDEQVLRTQKFLSDILECSERGLREALAYLEDHGFISREKRKGGTWSKSDVITLNIGTFTSTKQVDLGEDDLETHPAPDAGCPENEVSHPAPDAGPIRHETPHAIRHETPHIEINKLNKRSKKDTEADAPDATTTPPASLPVKNAQTLMAEWIDACNPKPPSRVMGQMAREIKNLLSEGIDYDAVRDGLIQLHQRGTHPSTLPSFVHNVQQRPTIAMQPSGQHNGGQGIATGTQRAMEAVAAGQRLQAQYDQQNSLGGITSGLESDRLALGPGSLSGQPEGGPRDHPDVVGNPQPFVFR